MLSSSPVSASQCSQLPACSPASASSKARMQPSPLPTSSASSSSQPTPTSYRQRDNNRLQTADAGRRFVVACRIRPQHAGGTERDDSVSCCYASGQCELRYLDESKQSFTSQAFDSVFGPECGQEAVMAAIGEPMLQHCMRGYRGCILCYGQTGSGKVGTGAGSSTYTMTGPPLPSPSSSPLSPGCSSVSASQCEEQRGLIPRILRRLFALGSAAPFSSLSVSCAYSEIYLEAERDLLTQTDSAQSAVITAHPVCSAKEAEALFTAGQRRRATARTNMNASSSRSHAILKLKLTMSLAESGRIVNSELALVDLAGSERSDASAAGGCELQREGIKINTSLSTLTRVMEAIRAGDRHVPYRDSRLTESLKQTLNGQSRTVVIANVAPDREQAEHTRHALQFAARCKAIKQLTQLIADVRDASPMQAVLRFAASWPALSALGADGEKLRAELITGLKRAAKAATGGEEAAVAGSKRQRLEGGAPALVAPLPVGPVREEQEEEREGEADAVPAAVVRALLSTARRVMDDEEQQLAVEGSRRQLVQAALDKTRILNSPQSARAEQQQQQPQPPRPQPAMGKENLQSPLRPLPLSPLRTPVTASKASKAPLSSVASIIEAKTATGSTADGCSTERAVCSYQYGTMEMDMTALRSPLRASVIR